MKTISAVFFMVLSLILFTSGVLKDLSPGGMTDDSELSILLNNDGLQQLGRKLFFDENLSSPPGQSCATCHDPTAGWTGPDESINLATVVYPGAVPSRFGNRKPSSAAYATLSPRFHMEIEDGETLFVGGNFWDGRATGWVLGNTAADQALGPFLNPVEMNNPDAKTVVEKVMRSEYAADFERIVNDLWKMEDLLADENTDLIYGIIGLAIAAFEHSPELNAFSSKYDAYLAGRTELTDEEIKGLEVFEGPGLCAECHPSRPGPYGEPPLFTDNTYDNLGIPRNEKVPWYRMKARFNPEGADWIDRGLAGFLVTVPQYAMYAGESLGKHRVPTLRNVDKRPSVDFVKVFGHNGYFKSLEEIVHFYNTRDVLPPSHDVTDPKPGVDCWPPPEVPQNVNTEELGNLGLTAEEEAAIVAFLKTLSDGYMPR